MVAFLINSVSVLRTFIVYFISRWEIPFKLTQIRGNLIERLSKTFVPLTCTLHSIGLVIFKFNLTFIKIKTMQLNFCVYPYMYVYVLVNMDYDQVV